MTYWARIGLVTGGNYGDNSTCAPYTIAPCGPSGCSGSVVSTPMCVKSCQPGYANTFASDKHRGKVTHKLGQYININPNARKRASTFVHSNVIHMINNYATNFVQLHMFTMCRAVKPQSDRRSTVTGQWWRVSHFSPTFGTTNQVKTFEVYRNTCELSLSIAELYPPCRCVSTRHWADSWRSRGHHYWLGYGGFNALLVGEKSVEFHMGGRR